MCIFGEYDHNVIKIKKLPKLSKKNGIKALGNDNGIINKLARIWTIGPCVCIGGVCPEKCVKSIKVPD